GQSTKVDVPPYIIIDVVDEDDDITDDEDALPHDLAESDNEDLINVDDDGVDKMLPGPTAVTVEVRIAPLHTMYPAVAWVALLTDVVAVPPAVTNKAAAPSIMLYGYFHVCHHQIARFRSAFEVRHRYIELFSGCLLTRKIVKNSLEVLKVMKNSLEVLKVLKNGLEVLKVLQIELQENSSIDEFEYLSINKIHIQNVSKAVK
nr:hypothetical protein [Tanacetum cinerariifolium]